MRDNNAQTSPHPRPRQQRTGAEAQAGDEVDDDDARRRVEQLDRHVGECARGVVGRQPVRAARALLFCFWVVVFWVFCVVFLHPLQKKANTSNQKHSKKPQKTTTNLKQHAPLISRVKSAEYSVRNEGKSSMKKSRPMTLGPPASVYERPAPSQSSAAMTATPSSWNNCCPVRRSQRRTLAARDASVSTCAA